ncbi:MAG: hypothetical protein ACRDV9_02520, partial [Acidimicrobiia bacterium]
GGPLGETTLSWSAPGIDATEVRVSANGGPEKLFSRQGTQGEAKATFIAAGSRYEFRLYPTDGRPPPLATVTVTRKA